jgi:multiple sugar transport system ATP-binding protein
MATVAFDGATRLYPGAKGPAVDGLTLDVADGEFLVMIGPSGCGKSTSLRMLAGLEEVSTGHVLIGDQDVTHVPAADRDIAMVFQNYALYPHMTVADNMGFALKIHKMPKQERLERVRETARLLDLEDLLERKPRALSGGQRQRVAMGRAIVRNPRVFLMDEPLSNLDAKLRVQTRSQISSLTRRLGVTTVYVTHDQTEALTMGDRIAVLSGGVLQQVGTPHELYTTPINVFVAGFIGSPAMNLVPVDAVEGGVRIGGEVLPVERDVLSRSSGEILLGIRPENLTIGAESGSGLAMHVDLVEELGSDCFVYGHAEGTGNNAELVVRVQAGLAPTVGSRLELTVASEYVHLFDAGNGQRINGSVQFRPERGYLPVAER